MITIINNKGYQLSSEHEMHIRRNAEQFNVETVTITFINHYTSAEIYSWHNEKDGDYLFTLDLEDCTVSS